MLSRSEGRSFFFEGFLHPDKGVAVVQAVQVEGCFPGVVEVGLRGVHYRRVEQRLATVHHVPEEDAHGIGKGFRLRPGGSIGHPLVEKTLQGLLRPVVVAHQGDLPRVPADQIQDTFDGGGLARPVLPDQAHDGAPGEGQVHPVQGKVPVGLAEAANFNTICHKSSP